MSKNHCDILLDGVGLIRQESYSNLLALLEDGADCGESALSWVLQDPLTAWFLLGGIGSIIWKRRINRRKMKAKKKG